MAVTVIALIVPMFKSFQTVARKRSSLWMVLEGVWKRYFDHGSIPHHDRENRSSWGIEGRTRARDL